MNAVETNKLTKTYGKSRGITELSLVVPEGDFFGFIGPNGAGKSTTIRTLLGLIHATGGSASVLGEDIVTGRKQILERTGYLPSEISFYNGMKVQDVIRLSASLRGKRCEAKASTLIERLGLDTEKKVDELSLGNRKKVGIVCAIQHEPDLLILDEPTSGLDPLIQKEFFQILTEENERGATIFFSSHILSEVQNYCKSAAFIKDGSIIIHDKVENLEKTGAKKITFKLSTVPDKTTLELKNGSLKDFITDINTDPASGHISFLYHGDIKKLLSYLSSLSLKDLSITEPTLEEIFMNYYK